MAKKEKKKKSFIGKFFGFIFKTILIVLLAVVLLVGYLYFGMKATKIESFSIDANAQAEPMSSAKRFVAYTDELSLGIRYDMSDICFLLYSMGMTDEAVGEKLDAVVEGLGFPVEDYGIEIKDGKVVVSVAADVYGIRAAGRVQMAVSYEDGTLYISPACVKIAGIPITAELINKVAGIDLSETKITLIDVTNLPLIFIEGVEDAYGADDCIEFKGKLDTQLLDDVVSTKDYTKAIERCGVEAELMGTAAVAYASNKEEGIRTFLDLMDKGVEFGELFRQYALIADTAKIKKLYTMSLGVIETRYIPQFTMEQLLEQKKSFG